MPTLGESAGYQRLLHATIDDLERRGSFPKTKKLVGLTTAEMDDLRLALRSDCLKELTEDSAVVNLDRILEREFGGDRIQMEAVFAQRAGRIVRPRRAAYDAEKHQLEAWLESRPEPAAEYVAKRLRANIGWITGELRKNGADAARERALDFLAVVSGLPLNPPRRFRTYARELGLPSKGLDPGTPLHRRLTAYLVERSGEYGGDDEEAVLRAAGLSQNMTSIHVLAYGPLTLRVGSTRVSYPLVGGHPFLLTWEMLASATLGEEVVPRRVLLVENETSFNEARSHLPADVLMAFTEGFPNRAVMKLVDLMGGLGVPIFHWGDIDGGGLRILRTLRQAAPVTALHMDATSLLEYAGQSLDETKARAIRNELPYWEPGPEREVLEACLRLGRWLEQETIPAEQAITTLSRQAPDQKSPS